ncbi:thioesterase family protein [Anaerosolibacter sp.]|uniref:thioesterase family protein n=1 Tax=Anaerosolibacter sp. TaxID=1872527 RepID=UPI0039F13E0F
MLELPKIKNGTSIVIQREIKEEDTALNYGSGRLENLLATPSLIALMIEGAVKLVDDKLPDGVITVGKMIRIEHQKPTGLGATVSVKVVVKEFDGARILFDIQAYDEIGMIGSGSHERWIVNKNSLLQRATERAEKLKNKDF